MQKLKIKTPRSRRALEVFATDTSTAGEVADSAARQASYGGGNHTLSHDGEIMRRESQVLEVTNYIGAKRDFELVLR